MAGARKCPSCGRWVKAGQSFCNDACAKAGCPHRLQVWTWIGDKLKPWTQLYAPLVVPCEVNHRTTPRLNLFNSKPNAVVHFHRQAGAWT